MSKPGDYDAVRKSIVSILDKPDYDDGSIGPVLIRLAWHASGTYDAKTDTGGSNGATMRYASEGEDPSNAGLEYARKFLEPVKAEHPWITYADLWTLAGVTALEALGGPKAEWKPGRVDYADDSKYPGRGRLPDGAQGAEHLRAVFHRMGFNDKDIVTLSGAHVLGRTHRDRSGWDGPWVVNPTRFSNQYFRMLTKFDWEVKDWDGPKQYYNDDLGEELMMLPTDICLTQDPAFAPWVKAYAEDQDLFFADFAKVFARLIELGVHREPSAKL